MCDKFFGELYYLIKKNILFHDVDSVRFTTFYVPSQPRTLWVPKTDLLHLHKKH